jgi:hypothetical protein
VFTAGDLSISTAGNIAATGAAVTIDATGIKGGSGSAKLTSTTTKLIVGSATQDDGNAAVVLDSVDYVIGGNIVINSGNATGLTGTLTLTNGAKISGLADSSTAATVALSGGSIWGGTGKTATGLSATSDNSTDPDFIAQTASGTAGSFVATYNSGNTALTIAATDQASATGA